MTYKVLLIHLLLLGYSYWVTGQGQNVEVSNRAAEAVQSPSVSSYGAGEEEEEDNSVMSRLQNITSLDEFIAVLQKDGNPVTTGDVLSNYTDQSGAVYISTGGRMAQPDDCSPRDTTVRLTFDNSNPNIVYFPRCTKIERCGGCCASPHLECVPSYTERVSYKVIKAEQPYPGSNHLEWKGEYATVILDRHVTCRVQCTLTADKCGPKKDFQERQCGCKCRVYERCVPPKMWDPEECECKCAEVHVCCPPGDACGMSFSKDTCECIVDTQTVLQISNNNETQQQIDDYFASLNSTAIASSTTSSSTSTPTTTASTTAATTTTTTTDSTVTATTATTTATAANTSATATNTISTTTDTISTTTDTITLIQATDPCLATRCPGNFAKVAFNATACVCRRNIGVARRVRNTVPPLR